jgi:hypothetical protein
MVPLSIAVDHESPMRGKRRYVTYLKAAGPEGSIYSTTLIIKRERPTW